MKLFEEFAKGVTSSFSQASMASPVGSNLITIKRRGSLPAEAIRIMCAIVAGEKKIDIGGAVLIVPDVVHVSALGLRQWAFNPPLKVDVAVKMFSLTAEIVNVDLVIHDGQPAVTFVTDSTLHPDIMFIFDERAPEPEPNPEQMVVTFNRRRMEAMNQAGVPPAKAVEVEKILEKIHASAVFHVASQTAFGTPRKERRAACKREAQQVYQSAQQSQMIGGGLIFWFTIGRYLLAAIEWLIWLNQEEQPSKRQE